MAFFALYTFEFIRILKYKNVFLGLFTKSTAQYRHAIVHRGQSVHDTGSRRGMSLSRQSSSLAIEQSLRSTSSIDILTISQYPTSKSQFTIVNISDLFPNRFFPRLITRALSSVSPISYNGDVLGCAITLRHPESSATVTDASSCPAESIKTLNTAEITLNSRR